MGLHGDHRRGQDLFCKVGLHFIHREEVDNDLFTPDSLLLKASISASEWISESIRHCKSQIIDLRILRVILSIVKD